MQRHGPAAPPMVAAAPIKRLSPHKGIISTADLSQFHEVLRKVPCVDRIFSIIYYDILGQHLSFARSDAAWFVALAQAVQKCQCMATNPLKKGRAAEGVRWRNVVLLSPGCTSSTFQWIQPESARYPTVKSTICWFLMRNIHSTRIHGMYLSDPWHMISLSRWPTSSHSPGLPRYTLLSRGLRSPKLAPRSVWQPSDQQAAEQNCSAKTETLWAAQHRTWIDKKN